MSESLQDKLPVVTPPWSLPTAISTASFDSLLFKKPSCLTAKPLDLGYYSTVQQRSKHVFFAILKNKEAAFPPRPKSRGLHAEKNDE